MYKMKSYLPIGFLGLSYLVAMIIVMNSHLIHGGHEAMLIRALEPIFNNETMRIKGMITLMPNSEEPLSKIMTMDFGIDGYINDYGHGEVSITYIQPHENNESVIAQVKQDAGQLWLVPMDPTVASVDLSNIFHGGDDEETLKSIWSDIYEQLSIDQRQVQDPRFDHGYLKREVTNYRLDLLALLDEGQLEELETAIGISNIEAMAITLDIQVDNEGDLLAMRLNSDTLVFNITGWLTLLP